MSSVSPQRARFCAQQLFQLSLLSMDNLQHDGWVSEEIQKYYRSLLQFITDHDTGQM